MTWSAAFSGHVSRSSEKADTAVSENAIGLSQASRSVDEQEQDMERRCRERERRGSRVGA